MTTVDGQASAATAPAVAPNAPGGRRDSFASLAEMRAEHRALLQASRGKPRGAVPRSQILAFLERGRKTGALLDTIDDRAAAQSLLDYWVTSLYSAQPETAMTGGVETVGHEVPTAVLEEFNAGSVKEVADRAEAVVRGLPPQGQETARRILLRLVRLTDSRLFHPDPVDWAAIESVDEPARVDPVLEALVKAGAVVELPAAESGGGHAPAPGDRPEPPPASAHRRYTLAHESLTRAWERLARWLDQRSRFRGVALYWDRHGGNRAALIYGPLLAEARTYHDLNEVERKFIAASQEGRVRSLAWAIGVVGLMAVIALGGWIGTYRKKKQEDRTNAQLTIKQQELTAKQQELVEEQRELVAKQQELETKQRLSNMRLLLRSLLEVLFAPNDAERAIAERRWESVAEALGPDSFFKDPLARCRGILSKPPADPNRPEDVADIKPVLDLGRDLRNQLLKASDAAPAEALDSARTVAYGTAQFCAEQICGVLDAQRPLTEAEPFIREFWVLYWGEMPIFEGPDVEAATVDFGRKLQDIRRQVEPDKEVVDLARKLGSSATSSASTKPAWSQSTRQGFAELYAQAAAAGRQGRASVEDLSRIEAAVRKIVPKADRESLDALKEKLSAAVAKELKGKIEPYAKPAAAL